MAHSAFSDTEEETTFQFLVFDEGGYQVVANVDGGVELRGRGGCLESGYRVTEVLRSSGIESSIDSHSY